MAWTVITKSSGRENTPAEFEIGIETFAYARRQGLGRAVAARMIVEVLQAGMRPVWSCRPENTASYRLAHALGFLPLRNLPYYQLRPTARGGAVVRESPASGALIEINDQ